jgi:RNA polymerase sigma-70 factor (ECF subfamily)
VWEEIQLVAPQTADAGLKEKESNAILQDAITRLSPKRRLVYELSRENALSHDQIAAYLNLSKSTVNNHLVESLRFIKHYLTGYIEVSFLCFFCSKNQSGLSLPGLPENAVLFKRRHRARVK